MQANGILDNALMVQIMLERLKSSTADTRDLVSDIRAAVASALSGFSGNVSSVGRVKSIAHALRKSLKPVLAGHSDRLLDEVINAAVVMANAEYHGFNSLAGSVNSADDDKVCRDVQNTPLSLSGWNGSLFLAKFIASWADTAVQQIENQAVMSLSSGGSISDLQSSINGTSVEPLIIAAAVVGRVARGFQMVARTTLQHAHSVAATDFYKENPDLIKYEEFSAILDNKTSAVCRSLSGNRYPLGEGPRPPLHPNCRSRLLPVLDDKYANLFVTEPVGNSEWGEETYYEWLYRQPANRQDIVLGKTRAQLFRDGGLSPERFAKLQLDKYFRPMTLKELKKIIPDAFRKADIELK
ncbi:phage Mu F like family protein [Xenorhabdus beddingii]|uniref:Phage Mu F like family protein n=1 Tax=Xenorhabdus beddingii TaxID=40578 RepID=A0A1Y2SE11_9GAMM|nr:minor capsid protein [Xenorhabdus beddingii]OTA15770.1 phage Mu F like family protein [Xenorhabdus beddingii]